MATTQRILIIVQQQGAQQTASALKSVGTTAGGANTSVNALRNSLAALGIGVGLRELVQAADNFTNISNRVRLASTDTADFTSNMKAVFDVSQETRTSLEATATIYSRLAVNTRDLGFEQGRLIGLVRSINQAVAVSGATAQEARNGLIQLSQGFASGQLRGEEFRAVAEQLPFLLIAIADGLGLTIGEVRKLAFQGALTPRIVARAIESQADRIQKAFETLTPTIEQAGVILGNAFTRFIGQINTSTKASQTFGGFVRFLASNIDQLATALLSAALAWGAYRLAVLAAGVASRIAATGIRGALVSTGIGALIVALGIVIDLLLQFGLSTQEVEGVTLTGFNRMGIAIDAVLGTVSKLVDVFATSFVGVGGLVSDLAQSIVNQLGPVFRPFLEGAGTAFSTVLNAGRAAVNALVGVFVGGIAAIARAFQLVPEVIRGRPLTDAIAEVGQTFLDFARQDFVGQLGSTFNAFFDNTAAGLKTISGIFNSEFAAAQRAAIDRAKEEEATQRRLAEARQEAAKLAFGAGADPSLVVSGTTEKQRIAAARQLEALEQRLLVAREKQNDPLEAQILKLQQQRKLAIDLAIKAGDINKAETSVNAIDTQILATEEKIADIKTDQENAIARISVALETIRQVSPEYAADLERALNAALQTAGGVDKVRDAIVDVSKEAVDAAADIQKELDRTAEAFASQLSSALVSGLRSAAQGEGFDVLKFLADQFAGALEESLAGVLKDLTSSVQSIFNSLSAPGGALEGLGSSLGSALGAAVGVAGIAIDLFSRDNTKNVTNGLVKSAVDSSQAVRGVVAGPTSIPIFQLGEELEDANAGVIAAINRVADILLGQAGTAALPVSLETQAGEVLGRHSSTLF